MLDSLREADLLGGETRQFPVHFNKVSFRRILPKNEWGSAPHVQHVTTVPDPKDELERVQRILERLEEVDIKLGTLESEVAGVDAEAEAGA